MLFGSEKPKILSEFSLTVFLYICHILKLILLSLAPSCAGGQIYLPHSRRGIVPRSEIPTIRKLKLLILACASDWL